MQIPKYQSRLTTLSNKQTEKYGVGHVGKFKRCYKQRGYVSVFWKFGSDEPGNGPIDDGSFDAGKNEGAVNPSVESLPGSSKEPVSSSSSSALSDGSNEKPRRANHLHIRFLPTVRGDELPGIQKTTMRQFVRPGFRDVGKLLIHNDDPTARFDPIEDTIRKVRLPTPTESEVMQQEMVKILSQRAALTEGKGKQKVVEVEAPRAPGDTKGKMKAALAAENNQMVRAARAEIAAAKAAAMAEAKAANEKNGSKPGRTDKEMTVDTSAAETKIPAGVNEHQLSPTVPLYPVQPNAPGTPRSSYSTFIETEEGGFVIGPDPGRLPRPAVVNPEWVVAALNDQLIHKREYLHKNLGSFPSEIVSEGVKVKSLLDWRFKFGASKEYPTIDREEWFVVPVKEGQNPQEVLEKMLEEVSKWVHRSSEISKMMIEAKRNSPMIQMGRKIKYVIKSWRWVDHAAEAIEKKTGLPVVRADKAKAPGGGPAGKMERPGSGGSADPTRPAGFKRVVRTLTGQVGPNYGDLSTLGTIATEPEKLPAAQDYNKIQQAKLDAARAEEARNRPPMSPLVASMRTMSSMLGISSPRK